VVRIWADVRGAFAFLTVFPIPWPGTTRPGRTFAYYPLVGLAIGAVVAALARWTACRMACGASWRWPRG